MSKDLIPVSIAYAVTISGAAITLYVCQSGFLLNALWADLVGTVIIFAFGRYYKNSSFYDAYWSVIPPYSQFTGSFSMFHRMSMRHVRLWS